MTTKKAPVTKSGCADDVGNTVSSAVAGALVIGDGGPTGADVDTGADGDGDGVEEVAASRVVAVGTVSSKSAMRSPVSFRDVTAGRAATDPSACTGSGRIQSRCGRRRSS
jgi:hypothetical protein